MLVADGRGRRRWWLLLCFDQEGPRGEPEASVSGGRHSSGMVSLSRPSSSPVIRRIVVCMRLFVYVCAENSERGLVMGDGEW